MHVRGLYEVLGGQPPVPTCTDTRVLELYPRQFTRDSLPYTAVYPRHSTRGEKGVVLVCLPCHLKLTSQEPGAEEPTPDAHVEGG